MISYRGLYIVQTVKRVSSSYPSPEEAYIADLDAKSGASLKLTILNKSGRIWTMVAGGGASVIYSDTICDLGGTNELANYGEYSGAPSEQQTWVMVAFLSVHSVIIGLSYSRIFKAIRKNSSKLVYWYSTDYHKLNSYEYAKTILTLMTKEKHPEGKVLIIGGGIANFTNVAATFKGIVSALQRFKEKLQEFKVQIFIRRGGPNYQVTLHQ